MENVKLNVKDKSVHTFLSENLLGYKPSERRSMDGDENPYYLMKDEMYFKKSVGLNAGDSINIELFDFASGSRKELVNSYTYTVSEYDDVAMKLTLSGFVVSAK